MKIINFPNEILCEIIRHLSIQDRLTLRRLNRKFRQLSFENITQIQVGKWRPSFKFLSPFEHSFTFNQRNLFELLLKECGSSLRYVFLFDNFDQNYDLSDWQRIVSSLPAHCPNLVGLCLDWHLKISKEIILSLFQHYGPQLQMACMGNRIAEIDVCNFAIQHFNPKCLRFLFFLPCDDPNLNKVVIRFPFLIGLMLTDPTNEVDDELPNLDFSSMQKLAHIREFSISCYLNGRNFNSLMSSPFVQRLETLDLYHLYEDEEGDQPFQYKLLRNLLRLRCLRIDLDEIKRLPKILKHLTYIEQLDLFLFVLGWDYEMLKCGMRKLIFLTKLKELRLEITFSHFVFDVVTSIFVGFVSVTRLKLCLRFEEKRKVIGLNRQIAVQLPQTFYNLIHFEFQWDQMSSDDLIECITNLSKLKSLVISNFGHDLSELKDICAQREIVLKVLND